MEEVKHTDSDNNAKIETENFVLNIEDETILTHEMKEEELLIKKNNQNAESTYTITLKKQLLEKELSDIRHKSLLNLLKKSEFYSDFLWQKIQNEADKENNCAKTRQGKRKRFQISNHDCSLSSSQESLQDDNQNFSASKRQKNSDDSLSCFNKGSIESNFTSSLPKTADHPRFFKNGTLRPYQLKGFAWLKTLYENAINGILADEMGLGKTVQIIAMLCYLIEMDVEGPFMVVAPLSTLPNWISEFHRFSPEVPVLLYHGNEKKRRELRLSFKNFFYPGGKKRGCLPVVLTSYEVIIRDRNFMKNYLWRYVVIDEGHRLKNHKCLLAKSLCEIPSTNRIILTGTPLQNNLSELWSLLHFLLPAIFNDLEVFESWFEIAEMMNPNSDERIVQQEKEKQIVVTLHKILGPFVLRRVKAEVDLEIPGKRERLVYVPATDLQLELYTAALKNDFSQYGQNKKKREDMIKYDRNGRPIRNRRSIKDLSVLFNSDDESKQSTEIDNLSKFFAAFIQNNDESATIASDSSCLPENYVLNVSIRNQMMLCRKIVNHPYLIKYPVVGDSYQIDEEIVQHCGKLKVMDQLLSRLHETGHKVLVFSQMTKVLDIIEDYLCLRPQYNYERLDGGVSLENRAKNIKSFNENEQMFLYLLTTRAGGLGINLTSADTVIIYDSDWNPQADLQAQDRCHRIGQTKPVLVLRLITANTVDQYMFERAAAKRKLEKMIIKRGQFRESHFTKKKFSEAELNPEELLNLLKSRDHERTHRASSQDSVFTALELDQILDRNFSSSEDEKNVEGIFKTMPRDEPNKMKAELH